VLARGGVVGLAAGALVGAPPPPPPPPPLGPSAADLSGVAAWPRLDKRLQPESWPAAAELLRAHAARRAAPRKSVPEFTLGDHFSEAPPTTTVQLGRRHFPGGNKLL
jgi:hypothetical protein